MTYYALDTHGSSHVTDARLVRICACFRQTRSVAGLFAAGSTTAACAFCSSAPVAAPAAVADATTPSVPKVTLYQYEPCPYCCKVKAVLDYLRIPYDVVEVNPLTKSETKALTDYKKVPVCTINGDVVVDSSAIISRLRELVRDVDGADATTDGVSLEEEERWRKWVDEKLVRLSLLRVLRTTLTGVRSIAPDAMTSLALPHACAS